MAFQTSERRIVFALTVTEITRVVPDVQAIEVRLKSGANMVISTLNKSEIMHFDRRLRSSRRGKSAKDRVTNFAARPHSWKVASGAGV